MRVDDKTGESALQITRGKRIVVGVKTPGRKNRRSTHPAGIIYGDVLFVAREIIQEGGMECRWRNLGRVSEQAPGEEENVEP